MLHSQTDPGGGLDRPSRASQWVTIEDLRVGYSGVPLLPSIRLAIRPGELWGLIGANGSGKTTFLRTLLGLLPRVGGRLELQPGVTIGYVPQRSDLDLSVPARVVDIVRGGLDRGWSFLLPAIHLRRAGAVERAMRDTETLHLAQTQFARLSEGQKQRVLLARALASDPQVLVLDEPTSAMDIVAERAVFDLIDALRGQRELAIVVVSHHVSLLVSYATHALFLDVDLQLAAAGPLEEVANHEVFARRYGLLADLRRGIPAEALSAADRR